VLHSTVHKEKFQQDATTYQNLIIPYLYETQHISGHTPPIISKARERKFPLLCLSSSLFCHATGSVHLLSLSYYGILKRDDTDQNTSPSMFVDPCIIVQFIKKIQQDATTYQNVIIPYLYEAQHISGDTPSIFRSLKLHVRKTRGSFRLLMMGGVSPETC
jgi:hypothetical protein